MTPQEAADYVASREVFGMRFGLERMHAVLGELGHHPQGHAPTIHVVGTNGKTSTTRFAAAALRATGRRVGAYVSPHVVDWRERIAIDGEPISPHSFARAVAAVAAAGERVAPPEDPVTQFEVLTAAALHAFADARVDAMVVEAGLGGRYDATNVFDGQAVVALTNVALEHTELLGDTEEAIAAEKLAVVADGSDRLVVGALAPPAASAVERICRRRSLHGWFIGREIALSVGDPLTVTTPLGVQAGLPVAAGNFQAENVALAVAAAQRLVGAPIPNGSLVEALATVTNPGRLEILDGEPRIVLDAAHNPAGVSALVAALPAVARHPVVVVFSAFADKDVDAMLRLLAPHCARLVATASSSARSRDAGDVAARARMAGLRADAVANPTVALQTARDLAGSRGTVLVCGSIALLADIRNAAISAHADDDGMLAAETRRKSS